MLELLGEGPKYYVMKYVGYMINRYEYTNTKRDNICVHQNSGYECL